MSTIKKKIKKKPCSQVKNRANKPKTRILRDEKGRFSKGISANPGGRPTNQWRDDLDEAIKKVQSDKDDELMAHAVKRAYENDSVLIAILKKLIPDMKTIEGDFKHNVTLAQAIHEVLSVSGGKN